MCHTEVTRLSQQGGKLIHASVTSKNHGRLRDICTSYVLTGSWKCTNSNFDVSLTVHLSKTIVNKQLDEHFLNTFITNLYMFRAISCSSLGGQIVLIQHLVSSLSVSERPMHRLCTGRSLTESDDTRCCIDAIWPPEDEQDIARNMYV
jgi:hypothetical protein